MKHRKHDMEWVPWRESWRCTCKHWEYPRTQGGHGFTVTAARMAHARHLKEVGR